MFTKRLATVTLVFAFTPIAIAHGASLTFTVQTDELEYFVGDTVDWSVYVQTDNSTSDNYGIANLDVTLAESQAESLSAATAYGPEFSNPPYSFRSPGTPSGSSLVGISATEFSNSGNAAQIGGGGPDLFASGSYTATVLGSHTLTASFFSVADHWNAAAPAMTLSSFNVNPGSVNFNVNAIPEPTTIVMLLGLAAGIGPLCWRRRARHV